MLELRLFRQGTIATRLIPIRNLFDLGNAVAARHLTAVMPSRTKHQQIDRTRSNFPAVRKLYHHSEIMVRGALGVDRNEQPRGAPARHFPPERKRDAILLRIVAQHDGFAVHQREVLSAAFGAIVGNLSQREKRPKR